MGAILQIPIFFQIPNMSLAKTKYTLVIKQYKQWRFQFKLQESLGRFVVRACMPLGPEPISGYLKVYHKKPSVYYRQPEFGLISDSSTVKLQTTNSINTMQIYVIFDYIKESFKNNIHTTNITFILISKKQQLN